MSQATVKEALLKTIVGIETHPNHANVVFRAQTEWVEDVRCKATIRDFPPMTIDEPPDLGGKDAAANPVELVLAALGTCQEIMYAAYASVMDIELESVKVNVRGYLDLHGLLGLDEHVPPGYKRITFETEVKSPGATEEQLETLVHTVERTCPVLDILQRPQIVTGVAIANGRQVSLDKEEAAAGA